MSLNARLQSNFSPNNHSINKSKFNIHSNIKFISYKNSCTLHGARFIQKHT